MALPSNVGYTTIKGRFIRAILDGVDVDREPDGVPISGLTITFTANLSPAIVRNSSATPPVTILIDPITATTNLDGVLVGADNVEDIVIVASNDPDLTPTGWTYKVRMSGPSIAPVVFDFIAPAGETIDLSSVVPVPPSPGSDVRAWQAAVADTLANKIETEALKEAAGTSAFNAGTAAAVALGHANEAQEIVDSIPTTNDPIIASRVAAPASATRAALDAWGSSSYARSFPAATGITYDGAGNVQTVTENGVTTTYTYNGDGSVHTDTRLGETRTYTYDGSGNLTGIAS